MDKNPLAVEFCKVALWLEAQNPGEPLSFLNHRIKCGDAIVGLAHRDELENRIADEVLKTLPGDDKDIATLFRNKNRQELCEREAKAVQTKAQFEKTAVSSVQDAFTEYRTFNHLVENTPEEIAAKRKAYRKFFDGKGFSFLSEKNICNIIAAEGFSHLPKRSKLAKQHLDKGQVEAEKSEKIIQPAAVAEKKLFLSFILAR